MRTSPNRLLAVVFGALYLVAGVVGFVVTAGLGFFAAPGRLLIGIFAVNPFADGLDVVIGAALLIAGFSTVAVAKIVNTIVGTLFLALGLAGLFIIGTPFNIVGMNGADNVLHFASAVVLLAAGLGTERSVKTAVTS
jgi:hypothetical protein